MSKRWSPDEDKYICQFYLKNKNKPIKDIIELMKKDKHLDRTDNAIRGRINKYKKEMKINGYFNLHFKNTIVITSQFHLNYDIEEFKDKINQKRSNNYPIELLYKKQTFLNFSNNYDDKELINKEADFNCISLNIDKLKHFIRKSMLNANKNLLCELKFILGIENKCENVNDSLTKIKLVLEWYENCINNQDIQQIKDIITNYENNLSYKLYKKIYDFELNKSNICNIKNILISNIKKCQKKDDILIILNYSIQLFKKGNIKNDYDIKLYSNESFNKIENLEKLKKEAIKIITELQNCFENNYYLLSDYLNEFSIKVKNLIKNSKSLYEKEYDDLTTAYIIIGAHNICTFLLSFSYKDDIKLYNYKNNKNNEKKLMLKKSKILNGKINHYTRIYSLVNLNDFFEFNCYFNNKIISKIDYIDIKKTIYCDFSMNEKDIDKLKKYLNNTLLYKIKFFFNFYTSYATKYRITNKDAQIHEINEFLGDENNKFYQLSFPYATDKNSKYTINNLHHNDNNVLFINLNTTVFGFINPINLLLKNFANCNLNEIFNHQSRYNSRKEFEAILSSNIYISKVIDMNINFRFDIKKSAGISSPIKKLIYIHKLINNYNKSIIYYSSKEIYTKTEENYLYFKLVNKSHLRDEEKETELLYKNLWQEANIITGRIYSFIGIIITLIGTIFAIYVYYTNNEPGHILINHFWIVLAILFGAITLYLGFVHMNKSKK